MVLDKIKKRGPKDMHDVDLEDFTMGKVLAVHSRDAARAWRDGINRRKMIYSALGLRYPTKDKP